MSPSAPRPPHILAALLFALLGATCALAQQPPVFHDSSLHYSFTPPPNWTEIPYPMIEKMSSAAFQELDVPKQIYVAGFQKEQGQYFTYPYLLVQHHPGVQASLEEVVAGFTDPATKAVEKKLSQSSLLSQLSLEQPTIDIDRHLVLNRVQMEMPNFGTIEGIVALFPGSDGIVQLNFYTMGAPSPRDIETFHAVLDSFRFDDGFEHPETSRWRRGAMLGAVWAAAIGGAALILLVVYRRGRRSGATGSQ